MRTIWKFPVVSVFQLELPVDAEILSVQVQHERPQMWVLAQKG